MFNPIEILSTYTLGTPDFGHSDIWHFNLALKFLLSKALKDGYFPFWSKDIGTGFPILGEGQIGMFNIYNAVAFKLLNPVLAFNLGFAVILLTAATGTYLFCRTIKLNRIASTFAATIFALSGTFITQMVHFNLVQAASFMPWQFFLIEKFLLSKQHRWLLLFAIILQQQIFSGFQQLVMISLIGTAIYAFLRLKQLKKIRPLLSIFTATALGLVLSLPQLLPTLEITRESFRAIGISVQALANYPFMPQNLLSFINPYLFGDPRVGTYPRFSTNWGIFWESTGYIGVLTLILALFTIIRHRKSTIIKPILVILIVSLILLLGKSTPFFFLFQLPPLSMFRVPARFLFLFVWALSIISAIGLSKIKNGRIATIIFFLCILDVGKFALTYHSVINTDTWLHPPTTAKIINNDPEWSRIYTVNPFAEWNLRFLTKDPKEQLFKGGWLDMNSYVGFRNSLDPNQNLYWDIAQTDYYTGIAFLRLEMLKSHLSKGIIGNPDDQSLTVSSPSAKLLSFGSVKYIISPYQTTTFPQLSQIISQPNLFIYLNKNYRPHAYLTQDYVIAENVASLLEKLLDPTNQSVVLEEPVDVVKIKQPLTEAKIILNSDLKVTITARTQSKSLLILTDSYYPGWKAYIDDTETKIYPVNLNQRAIIFPVGSHTVRFEYEPLKLL